MAYTPIEIMLYRYPQLSLTPGPGLSETEEYRRIVRNGFQPGEATNPFQMSPMDTLEVIGTPAGGVEVLFLKSRMDFERAVQILAYRGECKPLPASMGAVTVFGINNWRKIQAHKEKYLSQGGRDWPWEFKHFTENKENYKDTLILVSDGYYSALLPQTAGYEAQEWTELSRTIRVYHELAHVISKRMFPQNKNILRDELVADCIGITKALGRYEKRLAMEFLGVNGKGYYRGRRLENYIPEGQNAEEFVTKVKHQLDLLEEYCLLAPGDPWERLLSIERNRIAL